MQDAWRFVSNMQEIGSCVPGCEEVRIVDDRHSLWKVRAEIGPFRRLLDMKAETVELLPPRHGAFVATGRDLVTRGEIDLEPASETSTLVTYTVTAEAQGFGKSLVNNAISLVIDAQAAEFGQNVQRALLKNRSES